MRMVVTGSTAMENSSSNSSSRLLRQRAGDGQALLLAAGEQAAQRVEAVLDLVPQRGPGQAALDDHVELRLLS